MAEHKNGVSDNESMEGEQTQNMNRIGRDKRPSLNKGNKNHSCRKFARVRWWKGKQMDGE